MLLAAWRTLMSSMIAAGLIRAILTTAQRRYGLDPDQLLARTGLHEDEVKDPSMQVPIVAFENLLRAVVRRTRDPALGLYLGEDYELRAQGFWGYALLSSRTVGDFFVRNARYARLRSPMRWRMQVEGHCAYSELACGGYAPELVPIMIDMTNTALARLLVNTDYRSRNTSVLRVAQSERPHHRQLRETLQNKIEFDATTDGSTFDLELLEVELPGADPYLGELVTTHLDAQLSALTAADPRPLLDRVRRRIAARLHEDASVERVAEDLRVSVRTLQRKLDTEGTSFSALTAIVRHSRAVEYLRQTDDSIERISVRLGYGDASAFRRAFRRWAGCSPGTYRSGANARPPTLPEPRRA